jgi:serine phosphatase RsbU (regulator of sigma subunit)
VTDQPSTDRPDAGRRRAGRPSSERPLRRRVDPDGGEAAAPVRGRRVHTRVSDAGPVLVVDLTDGSRHGPGPDAVTPAGPRRAGDPAGELSAALADLALLARDVVPGCAEASVTVLHDGRPGTMAATGNRARTVDEHQYGSGQGPCLHAMDSAGAVAVRDYADEPRWPGIAQVSLGAGIHSSLSLPLQQDGTVLGALNMYGDAVAAFGDDSRRAAGTFARQAALVLRFLDALRIERVLHAREHEVAATLQRSLLPTLPEVEGLTAAARYLVSSSASKVGGDWYDLFPLPDGAIGVAIGDVMGHDVAAAAAMGQLRSVLRSYAYEGSSPSIVLDRMDRLVQGFEMAEVATAVYGRLVLDHGTAMLLFSNAGHLPPLVRHPDGTVDRLDRGTHHLIGALAPGAARRGEAAVSLTPGSLLVLYTDGLVETRARHFDEGIDQLSAVLARADATGGLERLCDDVVEAMVDPDPQDDVALLVLRIEPR